MTSTSTFTSRMFIALFYIFAALALVLAGGKNWTLAICLGVLSLFFLGMNYLETVHQNRKSRSNSASSGMSLPPIAVPPARPAAYSQTNQSSDHLDVDQDAEDQFTPLAKLHLLLQQQEAGYEGQVQALIDQCENIDEVLGVSDYEATALHVAILNHCPASVLSALIVAGGTAPMADAAEESWLGNYIEDGASVETLRVLLDMGVDPNALQDGRYTAVYLAICEDRSDLVELLIQYGAVPQEEEDENWLCSAIEQQQNDVVNALLSSSAVRAGLDLNSALVVALREDNLQSVCKLLEYNVDPMSRDVEDETAVSMALEGAVSEVLLLAMPLSHNNRWRLLGHIQAQADDSTTIELTERWLDKLLDLETAWQMGYGNPEEPFVIESSIDPNLIGKVFNLVAAQSLVLSGIDPFAGSNSPFGQAVNSHDPYIVATYLECLSQEQAEKKLTELGEASWVQSARTILGLRRFLRARYLDSR